MTVHADRAAAVTSTVPTIHPKAGTMERWLFAFVMSLALMPLLWGNESTVIAQTQVTPLVLLPERLQTVVEFAGQAQTIYAYLTWERSRETDTINGGSVGSGVMAGLQLLTFPDNVWDNGIYTPLVNRSAVPAGYQWASWKQKYSVDIRHFKATFMFPAELDPSTAEAVLFDPFYDSDLIPVNDNLYVYLNGVRKAHGGTNYGAYNGGFNGTSRIANETDGWYIRGGIKLSGFQSGLNTIDIVVEERAVWGGLGYLTLRFGPRSTSSGKPPVVLVHGWHGFGNPRQCSQGVSHPVSGSAIDSATGQISDFGQMVLWLQQDGFDVWLAHLDTGPDGTPSLEHNAWGGDGCLKDQIAKVRQETGASKVILMGHSMGGIVSREYIEHANQYPGDVQALFTLGSPHTGLNILSILKRDKCIAEQKGLCQLHPYWMKYWNSIHGGLSKGNTPPYFLIGGAKTGGPAADLYPEPNDGAVELLSALALNSERHSAIKSDVRGRYQTLETHADSVGHPTYFEPPTGQTRSQSYGCIQNVLLGQSNTCSSVTPNPLAIQSSVAQPILSARTPDLQGHLSSYQTSNHTIQIDSDGVSLFYLSWMTGTLDFTLTDPSGTLVDPVYASSHPDRVAYQIASGNALIPPSASYLFSSTLPGTWSLGVRAGATGTTGTDYLAFAAMEPRRTLDVAFSRDIYSVGDTAALTATLQGLSGGISGAMVQTSLFRSDAVTDSLTLSDMGGGVYRGTYLIPNAPGSLWASVTATGNEGGIPFQRQTERLVTISASGVQETGSYMDQAADANGDGRYESLLVEVELNVTQPGTYTIAADLETPGGLFVAHAITETNLAGGVPRLLLGFDGGQIQQSGNNGPYIVTHLIVTNLAQGNLIVFTRDKVWTTAAYDAGRFGRLVGDLTGDCHVDAADLQIVASRWGTKLSDLRYDSQYDFDHNNRIDIVDVMRVARTWGSMCS